MDRKGLVRATVLFAITCAFMVALMMLFGTVYAVMGVNIITAALMMLSKDLSVRPLSNLWSITAFMLLMGVGSYLACLNPLLGILVNFSVVFLVVFLSMQDLKSPMHFPMLLFYTTMVTMPITLEEMPDRLMVLVVSAVFIVGLNVLMNRGVRNRTSHEGVVVMCDEIRACAESVLEGGSPDHAVTDALATDLNRSMYDRLKSHFFTTPDDRTVLDLVVSLADLGRVVCRGSWSREALSNLACVTDAISSHEHGEIGASEVSETIESYIASNQGTAAGTELILRDIARELVSLESGCDRTYGSWRSAGIRTILEAMREEARRDSARFTFSVRMALMFSLVAFAWAYWGWENASVMLFTIIAVIVPFLEDSWKLSVMRLSGTMLGALVFGAAVILTGDNTVALVAISMAAAYGYILLDNGRYDRKMFFYTLIVMIMSSLTVSQPESSIVADRIGFTMAGIAVAIIANRVVLPYRVRDENMELAVRSMRISLERIRNIRDILDGRPDAEEEAGLAVLSASISQKMMLNADRASDPLAKKFQIRQDSLSVQCSSLYKAVPLMSPECREAVRLIMSADPDSEDVPDIADTGNLDPYETECVRRAEGIMATYRKNRKMMFDLIVDGYLEDGPSASLRIADRR